MTTPQLAQATSARTSARRHFHMIGIGGAGMSVVAALLLAEGHTVTGSDARESENTQRLRETGARVAIGQRAENVPAGAIVVRSTAIHEDNPELAVARQRGQEVWHRSQALAFAAGARDFVAVAGAHGKTTSSAMLAMALRTAGQDPSWAIGGSIRAADGSHLSGGHLGSGNVLVAEADESDASFLNYAPRAALVTNIEPDHLDFYGTQEAFAAAFEEFAARIVPGGLLVVCADDPGARHLATAAGARNIRVASYGRGTPAPGARQHVVVRGHGQCMIETPEGETLARFTLQVPGAHNELNATGVWLTGVDLGVDPAVMAKALESYTGTGRRFEPRGEVCGIRLFDDYAHHPTEVAATLQAAREKAGSGAVRVLFQPHLYSRTKNFAAEFARALAGADTAIVTGVYGAREEPMPGVEGDLITAQMDGHGTFIASKEEAARTLARSATPGDLLLTMGAGDVTELCPLIVETLQHRFKEAG